MKTSAKLRLYRLEISVLDWLVIFLLAIRVRVALKIEKHKRGNGWAIYDPDVEKEKLKRIKKAAHKRRLGASFSLFTESLFKNIIEFSKWKQEEQRNNAEK